MRGAADEMECAHRQILRVTLSFQYSAAVQPIQVLISEHLKEGLGDRVHRTFFGLQDALKVL